MSVVGGDRLKVTQWFRPAWASLRFLCCVRLQGTAMAWLWYSIEKNHLSRPCLPWLYFFPS